MKFYKIVNPAGHNGIVYREGFNIDYSGVGISFSKKDILAFIDDGTELYEIKPIGNYFITSLKGCPKKWKANQVTMKYIGKVIDNIQFLVEQGADIHAADDYVLSWAAYNNHLDIVKYLVEHGADIQTSEFYMLRISSSEGYIDIIRYLFEQGIDIHKYNDMALRLAARNGHLDIVKYLIENSKKSENYIIKIALFNAIKGDSIEIVEYIDEHYQIDGKLSYECYCEAKECSSNNCRYYFQAYSNWLSKKLISK